MNVDVSCYLLNVQIGSSLLTQSVLFVTILCIGPVTCYNVTSRWGYKTAMEIPRQEQWSATCCHKSNKFPGWWSWLIVKRTLKLLKKGLEFRLDVVMSCSCPPQVTFQIPLIHLNSCIMSIKMEKLHNMLHSLCLCFSAVFLHLFPLVVLFAGLSATAIPSTHTYSYKRNCLLTGCHLFSTLSGYSATPQYISCHCWNPFISLFRVYCLLLWFRQRFPKQRPLKTFFSWDEDSSSPFSFFTACIQLPL